MSSSRACELRDLTVNQQQTNKTITTHAHAVNKVLNTRESQVCCAVDSYYTIILTSLSGVPELGRLATIVEDELTLTRNDLRP